MHILVFEIPPNWQNRSNWCDQHAFLVENLIDYWEVCETMNSILRLVFVKSNRFVLQHFYVRVLLNISCNITASWKLTGFPQINIRKSGEDLQCLSLPEECPQPQTLSMGYFWYHRLFWHLNNSFKKGGLLTKFYAKAVCKNVPVNAEANLNVSSLYELMCFLGYLSVQPSTG